MNCPACGRALTEVKAGEVALDICQGGCGGAWFDAFELQKLDERHEPAGAEALDVPRDESVRIDRAQRRKCPKCGDVVMMRHYFGVRQEVEVDECPGCAGFWLDHGELSRIREQFESPEQRDQATREWLARNAEPELGRMAKESQQRLDKARRFARFFNFLCPSWYLRGKQDWGAF